MRASSGRWRRFPPLPPWQHFSVPAEPSEGLLASSLASSLVGETGKSARPWSAEGAVLGGVTKVLETPSLVSGDVVCDLVGNELLSLVAIINLRLEPS